MKPHHTLATTVLALVLTSNAQAAPSLVDQCFTFLGADNPRAAEAARQALKRAPRDRAAHLCLGRALYETGEIKQALAEFKEVERLSKTPIELGVAYNYLALSYQNAGDLDNATLNYNRQLQSARGRGDRAGEGIALNNLASIFRNRGDLDKALDYYKQSNQLKESETERARTYNNIGFVYCDRGDYPQAIEYMEKAIGIHERAGNYHDLSLTRLNLGSVLREAKLLRRAEVELNEGLAGVRKVGDKHWEATGLIYLARLRTDQKRPADAKAAYAGAHRLAGAIGAQPLVNSAARGFAAVEQAEKTRVYAGIEIGSKGARALVLAVWPDKEGQPRFNERLRRSINTTLISGVAGSGELRPEGIDETAQAVKTLLELIKTEQELAPESVQVVIGSALGQAKNRTALTDRIRQLTGKEARFVDAAREVFYNVIGSMPTSDEERGLSIDVGSGSTKIGYVISSGGAGSTVALELPFGSVTLSDAAQAIRRPGQSFEAGLDQVATLRVRKELAQQVAAYPALFRRSPVYLTGGAAWALITLLHPEKLDGYAPLLPDDLKRFRALVADASRPLEPNLDHIKDDKVRERAAVHVAAVTKTFTRQNLMAAATLLDTIADEMKLAGRPVAFSRYGSWLWGYLFTASATSLQALAKQ